MQNTLDKLLALPELEWEWDPSTYSGLSPDEQDSLIAISKEEHLRDKSLEDISDQELDASIHAYRALATFNDKRLTPYFLELLTSPEFEDENDYLSGDIPAILAQYGTDAIQPTIDTLNNQDIDEITRMPLGDALVKLATHSGETPAIIKAFSDYLQAKHFTRTLNAHIICCFVDLKNAGEIETIRACYAAHLVDIAMTGDLEDIEVALELRTGRDTELPNLHDLESRELHLAIKGHIGPRPDDNDIAGKILYIMSLYGRECSIQTPDGLHGFLTGTLLSPELIPPSQYMPEIWDDTQNGTPYSPNWENKDDAEFFMQIVMLIHNVAVDELKAKDIKGLHDALPEDNAPPSYTDWIIGLNHGISIWFDTYDKTDFTEDFEEIVQLSAKIIGLVLQTETDETISEASDLYTELKKLIYALHEKNTKRPGYVDYAHGAETYHREQPKISRNSPCPCGSGKKYKRCCLN